MEPFTEVRFSKVFCVASALMESHTERKWRAALVFGDYFSRIRKWESQKLLIRIMVASENHCNSLLS